MREFVAAGGELIIHGALLIRNSPTPELVFIFYHLLQLASQHVDVHAKVVKFL